jgi:hypothetical protein
MCKESQGKANNPRCYRCDSDDLQYIEEECPTGVVAPDGGQEWRLWTGYRCRQCGAREEL